MLIRREADGDARAVHEVHARAFGDQDAPDRTPVEAPLVDELRAEGDLLPALSFVAIGGDGGVTGHVCCSRATLDGSDAGLVGLGPLGVRPELHRAGIGSALMYTILGAADALGVPAVVLLGEPAYYSRFGFVPAADHDVTAPDPSWGGYFQIRTLGAYRSEHSGAFRYAPAFERL
ncbi:GNAT family N-acetyltransferase [Amycolatopsis antarctica]|uniref:GNAT family N-acetyltransferase n=1 Tax=Amycolatopsis antarctica TaxID=1854586 RepID=A0A263D8K5_9PSEU|nr:N-acetyltransferase [Amycolatopsis antarctica]OZM73725.1 GNAT family N-acetyltransferase [Amycolatopsis antarctica]